VYDLNKFIKVYNDVITYPTMKSIAEHFDVSKSTISRWIQKTPKKYLIDRQSIKIKLEHESIEKDPNVQLYNTIAKKDKQLKALKKQLRELSEDSLKQETLLANLLNIKDSDYQFTYQDFEIKYKKNKSKTIPIIPISDFHFSETVKPEQVSHMNEYNTEIAVERLNSVATKNIKIIDKGFNGLYDIKDIIVPLMGDIISGNIHEELAETNGLTSSEMVLEAAEVIINVIENYIKHLPNVNNIYVPCIVGNHGRMKKAYRFKNAVQENFEYLAYKVIEKHFRNSEIVKVEVSESVEMVINVLGKNIYLHHGNLANFSGGVGGITIPLNKAVSRIKQRYGAIGVIIDYVILGHWHQHIVMNDSGLIVCGSLKGLDEYSLQYASGSNPSQPFLLFQEKYGLTFSSPIYP